MRGQKNPFFIMLTKSAHEPDMPALPEGAVLYREYLNAAARRQLMDEIAHILQKAPLFTPRMPRTGRSFSVRMSNAGSLGWVSDKERGYRYEPCHPRNGRPWPAMPRMLLELWRELTDYAAPPQAALINYYAPGARLGLHVDRDEEALNAPLVSVSLGAVARFRLGGRRRRDPTISFELRAGDVLVLSGPARLLYHGVERIYPQRGEALPKSIGPGRINITLRRVTRP